MERSERAKQMSVRSCLGSEGVYEEKEIDREKGWYDGRVTINAYADAMYLNQGTYIKLSDKIYRDL